MSWGYGTRGSRRETACARLPGAVPSGHATRNTLPLRKAVWDTDTGWCPGQGSLFPRCTVNGPGGKLPVTDRTWRLLRTTASPLLLLGCSLLTSCASAQIPQEAADELLARWEALPRHQTHALVIVDAWPGRRPAFAVPDLAEIWCVESALAPRPSGAAEPTAMLWVVARSAEDSDWEAAPRLTMSSTWAYEACREGIP